MRKTVTKNIVGADSITFVNIDIQTKKNLKVGYNKVFGYFIEVSKGNIPMIKDEYQYIRKQTLVNAERYITPLLKEKENLSDSLGHFSVHITDTKDFSSAQCSRGGIPLDEINMHTMESLKTKDLYVIGEMLDVDGDCGGYNLGFAWLSGIRCGKSL